LYEPGPGTPLSKLVFYSSGPPRNDLAVPSYLSSFLTSYAPGPGVKPALKSLVSSVFIDLGKLN